MRSGWRKSWIAEPSRRNSGFDTTATSLRPSARSTTRVEPDRHGRLVDDDGLARQQRADLAGRRPRCRTGRRSRRRPAASARRGRRTRSRPTALAAPTHEREPAAVEALAHEVVEARLEDRDLAPLEQRDLVGVDVGAHDVVADVGEARAGGEPDVARADDRDLAHAALRQSRRARSHQAIEGFTVVREQGQARQAQGGVVEHRVGGAGRRPGRVELGGGDRAHLVRVVRRPPRGCPARTRTRWWRPGW